jgi:hydrogenase/urease accessory protein HupE
MMGWRSGGHVVIGLLLTLLFTIPTAHAHETRPAYLELKETSTNQFSVAWRTPVLAGMRLPVALKLPDSVRNLHEPQVLELTDSQLERRWIDAGPDGLAGQRIAFPGLQLTITDVLVSIQRLDGTHSAELIHPSRPWFEITAPRGTLATAGVFFTQGIEHILRGADHLLFVLGLLLIVRSTSMLIKTITSFTVAHSITLAIATLGYAQLPISPLNAAIALSILFLGPEIVREKKGETSFTIRHPWVVAFAFGLLHGFGFASGLTAIGLPQDDIPLALLMFNIGVEAGQLSFVAVILLLVRAFKVLEVRWPQSVEMLPAYIVGGLGAFWTIQRFVLLARGV